MNSIAQFITVLLIFLMVLAVTYFVTRWIGSFQRSQGMSGNIEVIESARIAQNTYVQIVRIGQRYVALSVSKDATAYICEVPKEEIVFKDNGTAYNISFSDILSRVRDRTGAREDRDDTESHRDE